MKTKAISLSHKSWALPGDNLSLAEFKKGISDAEKGPFYTIEESKNIIAEWRHQRNSK